MGKKSRWLSPVFVAVFAISIAFLAYVQSFEAVAFDMSFYRQTFFSEHNAVQADAYLNATGELLTYLRYSKGEKEIPLDIFSGREKQHLVEVKGIIQGLARGMLYLLVAAAASVLAVYLLHRDDRKSFLGEIVRGLRISAYVIFGLFAAGIVILLTFSSSFILFHEVVFRTDTWLLSPDSTLILMFPESFFFNAAARIFFLALFYGILLFLAGKAIGKKPGEKQKT
jgi:integral membrane protein (TIGR01906 family)